MKKTIIIIVLVFVGLAWSLYSQRTYCKIEEVNDTDFLITAKKGKKYIVYNEKGEKVLTTNYDILEHFKDGLAIVSKGGKNGYINKKM